MFVGQRNAILLEVGELVRDFQQRSADVADSVLDELTRSAAKFVPGAQFAGITVVDRKGAITTVAPTHDFVVTLDDVQRAHEAGPCLTAGIERLKISAVQAFDLLKRLSQTSNTPVVDVARRLVDVDHPLR